MKKADTMDGIGLLAAGIDTYDRMVINRNGLSQTDIVRMAREIRHRLDGVEERRDAVLVGSETFNKSLQRQISLQRKPVKSDSPNED